MTGQRQPLFLLLALTTGLFASGLLSTFVLYDDDLHIFRNVMMRLPWVESVTYYWSHIHKGFYIPVTYTLWATLIAWIRPSDPFVTFDNLNPLPFHALSLVVHLLNICLLWRLTHKFTQFLWVRYFAVLLFAIHPLQVESVSWATGLKDLVAVFFSLCAMTAYWTGSLFRWFAPVFYLLGVFSKPAVLTLPLGIILMEFGWRKIPLRRHFPYLLSWLFLSLPIVFLTSKAQPVEGGAFVVPWWLRPSVMMDSILFYVWKFLFPYSLVHDYGRSPEWLLHSPFVFLSPVLFLIALYFSIKYWNRARNSGLLVFICWLLPVSGLIQFSFQSFSTVADHYFYFPSVSITLLVCYLFGERNWPKVAYLTTTVVMVLFGGITLAQVRVWKNTPRLLSHTLEHNPNSVLAHNNYGVYYEWVEEWDKALRSYRLAYQANPRFMHHLYNIGNILMREQRLDEARECFLKILEKDPKYTDAHFNLGLITEAYGDFRLAGEYFLRAIELQPTMHSAHVKYAGILNHLNEWEKAVAYYEQGIALNPLSPQAHMHFAHALKKRGWKKEAEEHYRAAESLRAIDDAAKKPQALLAR